MAKTVIGLVENQGEARKVIDELLQNGFDRKHIGVVSSEVLQEATAALAGAGKGIAIGGLAGMLLAAATLALPGIGAVLVAGPALTLLAGTTVGALAGGLIGGLKARGVPEEDAQFYEEGVRRGGTLITVNAANDELAARAVEIMKRHGAVDMEQRAEEWKKQGWEPRPEAERAAPSGGQASAQPSSTPVTAAPASVAAAAGSELPLQAERMAPAGAGGEAELGPDVPLSAVSVYSIVIEVPLDDSAEAPMAAGGRSTSAANQPLHAGPERRTRSTPYAGTDRRHAA